jgi:tRNA U38,U39,U40 pseudouridine synthase TruA
MNIHRKTVAQLVAEYPLAAAACGIEASHCRTDAAVATYRYSRMTGIGEPGFDSCEQLLSQIEEAERAKPMPLTDDDIEAMNWKSSGTLVGPHDLFTFATLTSEGGKRAITVHNADIASLHAEIRRLRAIAGKGKP